MSKYKYPKNKLYEIKIAHEPFPVGEHDKDDIIGSFEKKNQKQFNKLVLVPTPKQRSVEWFDARKSRISASDAGSVLGVNHYKPQYAFVLDKALDKPFPPNYNCYYGTMMEQIATMIYEFRIGVIVREFGTIPHTEYKFLSASPDGIVSHYKTNGINLTSLVATMLEIKCVTTRKIMINGQVNIPPYYEAQMRLQMECCNLPKCHFWQTRILEYDNRKQFIEDTAEEPFRSRETNMEKGCLIQVLPKDRMQEILDNNYDNVLYSSAQHIYPPKINMTPYDCDIWIAETLANLDEIIQNKIDNNLFNNPSLNGYFFNKVRYWKVCETNCTIINREEGWMKKSLPIFQKTWSYVEYFRNNNDKALLLEKYIAHLPDYHSYEKGLNWKQIKEKEKNHEEQIIHINKLMDDICNEPDKLDTKAINKYNKFLKTLIIKD
jgi:putative phage-type endonuclease